MVLLLLILMIPTLGSVNVFLSSRKLFENKFFVGKRKKDPVVGLPVSNRTPHEIKFQSVAPVPR